MNSKPLDEESLELRRLLLRALQAADKGHVGSALSLLEILRVLYDGVLKHDPRRPTWQDRDRLILSKGHGCLALYVTLAKHRYFPLQDLDTFCARNSLLGGHPERHLPRGIEASTGALGHGLPLAVGAALALRRQGREARVFVIVGDGELNEGSNWEAFLIASKYQLSNLTVIVDNNAEQISGTLDEVLPMEPLRQKLETFGLEVTETDGHDLQQLRQVFLATSSRAPGRPRAILARTVKGRGLSFAEHNPQWHYCRGLTPELIRDITAQWGGADLSS